MFAFNNDNTFCINLTSNPTRWANIQKRFTSINLPVTHWPASTPNDLTDTFVTNLSPNQKACAQSHINIWRHIIQNNLDYALILEDDACFDKQFWDKLNTITPDPEWHMVVLNASEPMKEQNKWCRVYEQYLTGGYILSNNGAKIVLDIFANNFCASDWMTSRLELYNHSYSYFPWLIIQEGNESTIGSGVELDHKKVLKCLGDIGYSLDNYII